MARYRLFRLMIMIFLITSSQTTASRERISKKDLEFALLIIHNIASGNTGSLCVTKFYQSVFIPFQTSRYEGTRQKADMAALFLQELGVSHHSGLLDAISKSLILSDRKVLASRILALNVSTGNVITAVTWRRPSTPSGTNPVTLLEINGPVRALEDDPKEGIKPDRSFPWYEDSNTSPVRSPKFMTSPANVSYKGWWTFPYYSCSVKKWLISYSVPIPPSGRHSMKGFLTVDVDISNLDINQCEAGNEKNESPELAIFHGTHKCHNETLECKYKPEGGWSRGSYDCICKLGYYRRRGLLNGTIVEAAWQEKLLNESSIYDKTFKCRKCSEGCHSCKDSTPCLATYNWPYRIALLSVSLFCVAFSLALIYFVYRFRKLKVFKVASPIFLGITLCGCAIMYLEMAAIFPILDRYSCIITKWSRHMGFCITYTALLMKTWRVSLTYRVKSAHKVKLTDKQLLQWMFPILLVMIIYLGAWTLSDPPNGEIITDGYGLMFKQCTFNWWDHSIAIGEVLFLAWGIKICYDVRNAESFYNEARLISYAIYNIAIVNIAMVAFHLLILPNVGPDIKYLLGFIRTQLSTTVTIVLVFGQKMTRVWHGLGDQWDNKSKAKAVTTSFPMYGMGSAPEEPADVYQENEELKEEVQKLASQIEFMRIVHMETNNPHLRPRPGSYFQSSSVQAAMIHSPRPRMRGIATSADPDSPN